jgi:hypothetical protein
MDPVQHNADTWGRLYPAAAQRAVEDALVSIMTAIIRDAADDRGDFYFEIEDGGYTHIDGHLRLTPEQIAAVRTIQGKA